MNRTVFNLISLFILFTPLSAHASWDYVAYGNGQMIADVLEGIKSIIGSTSEYRTIVTIIAITCFVWVLAKAIFDSKYVDIAIYFIIVFLGQNLLFSNTIDILVTDPFDAAATQNVTDVPFLVGFPVVAVNAIGTELTETYETNFASMDASLQISGGSTPGTMARILRDMSQVSIGDANLKGTVSNYYQDCVMPMIYDGSLDVVDITNSSDVLTTIRSTHQARFTLVNGAGGQQTMTCNDAWSEIRSDFNAAGTGGSDNWYNIIGSDQGVGNDSLRSAFGSAMASDALLDAAILQGTGQATSGSVYLANTLLAGGFDAGLRASAVSSGSNETLMALNMDQARRSQEISWFTSGELFQDMAGYFYSTMNVLIIALTPLLMIALFIPKAGMKVVGMYFKVLIWLALWWPGLAIVNYMSSMYLSNQIIAAQPSCIGCGFGSVAHSNLTSAFAQKASNATGFIATIVPMLMWGIVSGSAHALVGALQQASGKQEAASAAKNIATDSYQTDNISYNNTAANKFDNTSGFSTGQDMAKIVQGNAALDVTDRMASLNTTKGSSEVQNTLSQATESQMKQVQERKTEVDSTLQTGLTNTVQESMSLLSQYGQVENGTWQWKSQETYQANKEKLDQAMADVSAVHMLAHDKTNAASDEAAAAIKASTSLGIGSDNDDEGKEKGFIKGAIDAIADKVGFKARVEASATGTTRSVEGESTTDRNANTESTSSSTVAKRSEGSTESLDRSNAQQQTTSTSDSSAFAKQISESRVNGMVDSHSKAMKELESVESRITASQTQSINQDVTYEDAQRMISEHQATLDKIKVKNDSLVEEYEVSAQSTLDAVGMGMNNAKKELLSEKAEMEIKKEQAESRFVQGRTGKADDLSEQSDAINADVHAKRLATLDTQNETNLSSGKSAETVELGNGYKAIPMGMANIDDGKGGYTTELVYDFKDQNGEVMGV